MAIRGAKLTFGGGKKNLGVQKLNKPIRKTKKKKWRPFFLFVFFFLFFLETVKCLYFLGAPFGLNGRAPFKLVTPLSGNRTGF